LDDNQQIADASKAVAPPISARSIRGGGASFQMSMKLREFAIVLVVSVIMREYSGQVIYLLTGVGALANFGSLALASFFGGSLASPRGRRPPTDRQFFLLAVLCVIACTTIGYLRGVGYIALGVIFILIVHTPISYVCLILGAKAAEGGFRKPSPRSAPDEASSPHR
jgi:hypothetical protein